MTNPDPTASLDAEQARQRVLDLLKLTESVLRRFLEWSSAYASHIGNDVVLLAHAELCRRAIGAKP